MIDERFFSISSLHSIAPAKINFFLHVTARRKDGYHELDSLTVFAKYGDNISLEENPTKRHDSLHISGDFADILNAEKNISSNSVLKACRIWREAAQEQNISLPFFNCFLEKNLPVAAGIGGGSADASATLNLLRQFYPIPHLKEADYRALALKLGADGPVTIDSMPKRMQGIGEILTKISNFPELGILLVNPRIKVSTPAIFKKLKIEKLQRVIFPEFPTNGWENAESLFSFLNQTRNDLQLPAIRLVPEIQKLLSQLKTLPACQIARMSGSGATCFALFKTKDDAMKAGKILRSSPNTPQNWWIWSGETYPSKQNPMKDF
ncbi:4-(cytidine 5'-diphospho)-2-C-methyl-D-erythritol kinase [Acetobacteraceae bacterium]|nr:4-(cytidine 5'-diphospho)-2-C-methyl-D-erythritol kinase [Acetobacteraceae bacterium]